VVRLALTATLSVGLVLGLVAGFTGGAPAVVGVAIGTLMVCLFFGLGAIVLDVVATLAPAASLLIALLTYTLQVVLIGLVFVGLKRSGLLEGSIDPRWLGGAVIAGTLAWLAAQVFATTRLRIPAYDLTPRETADEAPATGGGDASRTKEAGER
jgi:ATP synthase protein I